MKLYWSLYGNVVSYFYVTAFMKLRLHPTVP